MLISSPAMKGPFARLCLFRNSIALVYSSIPLCAIGDKTIRYSLIWGFRCAYLDPTRVGRHAEGGRNVLVEEVRNTLVKKRGGEGEEEGRERERETQS